MTACEIPIYLSDMIEDGKIVTSVDLPGPGHVIFIGTRPLTWAEATLRRILRDQMADTYRWLGWRAPDPEPGAGERVWARIREACTPARTGPDWTRIDGI